MKPNVLVLAGYGINCEEETAFAFKQAGAVACLVHVNDVAESPQMLKEFQILAIPGGFSFGDDLGAGKAMANLLKQRLTDRLVKFIQRDTLVLGVCNGFQVLVAMGLLPALYGSYQLPQVDLMANDSGRYTVRWVDVQVGGRSPWLTGLDRMMLPIAHGEGKFYTTAEMMEQLNRKKLVALRYVKGEICRHFELAANPNGALEDVAGITDETGRILGMMPHPERAIAFTHLPHWTLLKEQLVRKGQQLPTVGPGMQVFINAVNYFK